MKKGIGNLFWLLINQANNTILPCWRQKGMIPYSNRLLFIAKNSLIWETWGMFAHSTQELQPGSIFKSMLPLGLSLNLDFTLNLNLSVRTQDRYCFKNPIVKGKCQEAWLILAMPPSTPQPEGFKQDKRVLWFKARRSLLPTSPTPHFAPLHAPAKKNRNNYCSASKIQRKKSSSPPLPNLLKLPWSPPCTALFQVPGESYFDQYKIAMASLRFRLFLHCKDTSSPQSLNSSFQLHNWKLDYLLYYIGIHYRLSHLYIHFPQCALL